MDDLVIGNYQMKPMTDEDLKRVLDWRNSDRIRNVMVNTHKISLEEHTNWYNRHKNDAPCRYFVFYHKEKPIGYIGYNDFVPDESCDPGMYIGEDKDAPANAGFAVFYFSTEYAFEVLNVKFIHSLVLKDNKKSIAGSEMLGFQHNSFNDVVIDERKYLYYALTKEIWNTKRLKLRKWL